ncbi:MAG: WecB/TagA/CpsF family glycosyltransferase [Patescibacteria group bacterium]
MKLAGIQLRPLHRAEALARFSEILKNGHGEMVVTMNPEMIVHATRDQLFKTIIHSAEMHLIDGFGIQLVARLKRWPRVERLTGVDAIDHLCEMAAEQGSRVFFLGTRNQTTLMRAAHELKRRYPKFNIVGTHVGSEIFETHEGVRVADPRAHEEAIDRINVTQPDMLFVAFGHSKQEKWIWHHKKQLPSVKLFMGVGGAFEMIAGDIRRAPRFMRRIGLEWAWRLAKEPWRGRRVWNATAVFLWKALR